MEPNGACRLLGVILTLLKIGVHTVSLVHVLFRSERLAGFVRNGGFRLHRAASPIEPTRRVF